MPAGEDGEEVEIRSFGTTTTELEALAGMLVERRVVSVAMESTSVYWIPLYELLEERGIEPVLVNARQLQSVPSRKTDIHDCQWIQTLHSHGLLRGSSRPVEAIVRLRSLHRQQTSFVETRIPTVQWMQKALDQMNVQVHRAVTDLTGETGMAIVRAIVAGECAPARAGSAPPPPLRQVRGADRRAPPGQTVRRPPLQPEVVAEALRRSPDDDRGI